MSNASQTKSTVTPPAGFKIQYFDTCGMGHRPEGLPVEGIDCEIIGSAYEGPSFYLHDNTGFQLNSYWNEKEGITFQIHSHGWDSDEDDAKYGPKPITRKELSVLPAMVQRVLEMIDDNAIFDQAVRDYQDGVPEHYPHLTTQKEN